MKKFLCLIVAMCIALVAGLAYSYETNKTGAYRWLDPQIFTKAVTFLNDLTVTGSTVVDDLAVGTSNFAFGTTDHYDAVDVGALNSLFLDSSSFAGTIGGLANGVAGQFLIISVTDATEVITVEHNEATGTQKMFLDGAADAVLNVNEGLVLQYNGSNWIEARR